MLCPEFPKDIWTHIRSFSGDTGYEPTPTAKLFSRDILVRDDTAGTWLFPFGRDGYASTVVLAINPGISSVSNHRTGPGHTQIIQLGRTYESAI